jgi:hypothetical protein
MEVVVAVVAVVPGVDLAVAVAVERASSVGKKVTSRSTVHRVEAVEGIEAEAAPASSVDKRDTNRSIAHRVEAVVEVVEVEDAAAVLEAVVAVAVEVEEEVEDLGAVEEGLRLPVLLSFVVNRISLFMRLLYRSFSNNLMNISVE